jgi:hypothetical protein
VLWAQNLFCLKIRVRWMHAPPCSACACAVRVPRRRQRDGPPAIRPRDVSERPGRPAPRPPVHPRSLAYACRTLPMSALWLARPRP